MSRPSLFEFAGGDQALLALAAAFHDRCLQDPVLNHPFSHTGNPEHVERLAEYWAEVLGGPARYSESHGGHSAMLEIHARTGAGDDFGPRFVACFMQALDDAKLSDDPGFRAALRSYMEWAVLEVMSYSPHDAEVPTAMRTPRWSWSGPEQVAFFQSK